MDYLKQKNNVPNSVRVIDVLQFRNNEERIINLCCYLFRNALITDNIDNAQ